MKYGRSFIIIFNYDSCPYTNALHGRLRSAVSKKPASVLRETIRSNLTAYKKPLWNFILDTGTALLTAYDNKMRNYPCI